MAAALAVAVLFLPDPAPTLAPLAASNLPATGLGNPVTTVLMAFRAMDTLLEKVVLLLALVGVWSLAPDRVWGGRPGPRHQADPHGMLVFLARLLPPVGIVVGIYLLWVGADEPGGAFQGGTILAAMWLLVMMAGLADTPPVRQPMAAPGAHRRPGRLPAGRPRGTLAGRRVPRLSGGVRQAAHPGHRDRDAADDRADARPAGGRSAGTERATVNPMTVFGLWGAVAVGLGLYGMIVNPQPLRKILAFNLLGSGVFLLFGVVARRGAAAGFGGDPVPQALVITGVVVAFAATALTVALWLRLFQETGSATLPDAARTGADTESRRRLMMDPAPALDAVTTSGGFLLVLALVLPVAGVLLAFVAGGRHAERIALATMPLGLAIAVTIVVTLLRAGGPLVYLLGGWAPPLGVVLRADSLSAVMLADDGGGDLRGRRVRARGVSHPGRDARRRARRSPSGSCCSRSGPALDTVFLAGDLFTLYVALELLTFAAVPLVCLDGRPETLAAALRYVLFALIGSVLYLVGTVLLYGAYGVLDIVLLSQRIQADPTTLVAAALMTVGLLAKTALFPAASLAAARTRGRTRARQRGALGAGGEGVLLHRGPTVVRCDAGPPGFLGRPAARRRWVRRRSWSAAWWRCARSV